jgi:murein DD-endopeptidase MepM/ murein hydrolase activator NlpD
MARSFFPVEWIRPVQGKRRDSLRFYTVFFTIFLGTSLIFVLFGTPVLTLANLEYTNPDLKSLRTDIKENLRLSRARGTDIGQRTLRFYEYTVKKEDNFFKIMAKTGMNLDTLSSVNHLSSPHDLQVGKKIRIPNMRGVYYSDSENQIDSPAFRKKVAEAHSIHPEKLIFDSVRKEWFIPGGELVGKEKMFFYGFVFSPPLADYRISSQFGKRLDPFTNRQTFHGGVDLAAPKGTPILASADGVVEFSGTLGGYGKCVIIKHELGYETRYGHMSKILAKVGQSVKKGEKLGEVGQTGRATGDHLHFEVRRFSKRERPVFRDHK